MIFVQAKERKKPKRGHLGQELDTKEILINLHAIKRIEGDEVEDYNGTRYSLFAIDEAKRSPWGSRIEDCLVKIGE